MNSPRTGLRVASVVFAIFAVGHIARLISQAPVTVSHFHAPMGASVVALIVAVALSIWLWQLSSRAG